MAFQGTHILSAVLAWWDGTPAMSPLVSDGQLHHLSAPEGVQLPYATFFLVADPVESNTTGFQLKRSAVQINLHAATDLEAATIGLAVRDALTMAPLMVGDQTTAHVLPDGDGLEVGEGLGPDGRDCWIATETFDILWTR